MIRVVVTGATGFIGRHLLTQLVSGSLLKPDEIICFTRKDSVNDENYSRIRYVKVDLRSLNEEQKSLLRSAHFVFHLAANPSVDSGQRGFDDNVGSTNELVTVLKDSEVLKRFVFVSSIGAIDRDRCDLTLEPLNEESKANPRSIYGRGKLECEKIVQSSKIPYTIVRPAWVYGSGMRSDSHLSVLFQLARQKKLVTSINFPGKVSLCRVEMLVEFLELVALKSEAQSQTYFHATSPPFSIGKIFKCFHYALYGQQKFQLQIPGSILSLLSLSGKFIPLKGAILLFNYLTCSREKAKRVAPHINFDLDPEQEIVELSRLLSEQLRLVGVCRPCVVVSGAGSGIGRALCILLYNRGYDLFLVDKDKESLEELRVTTGEQTFWIADLELVHERERLCQEIRRSPKNIVGLINCAGKGLKTDFCSGSIERQQSILSLNVDALVVLSHCALRRFDEYPLSGCFLVNLSSSSAFQPLPYFSVYSASKAFVTQFTQSLVGEYEGKDINILTIAPGGTATGFQASAEVNTSRSEELLSPFYVAGKICDAVESKRRGFMVIGVRAICMELLGRILGPQWGVSLWRRLVLKMR